MRRRSCAPLESPLPPSPAKTHPLRCSPVSMGRARGLVAHDDFHREEAIKGPSNRSFGWTFTGVFLVVGVVRLALDHSHWQWWLAAGAAFAAVTLLRAELLAPLNRLWLKFGLLLHKVVNPLVMGVL